MLKPNFQLDSEFVRLHKHYYSVPKKTTNQGVQKFKIESQFEDLFKAVISDQPLKMEKLFQLVKSKKADSKAKMPVIDATFEEKFVLCKNVMREIQQKRILPEEQTRYYKQSLFEFTQNKALAQQEKTEDDLVQSKKDCEKTISEIESQRRALFELTKLAHQRERDYLYEAGKLVQMQQEVQNYQALLDKIKNTKFDDSEDCSYVRDCQFLQAKLDQIMQ